MTEFVEGIEPELPFVPKLPTPLFPREREKSLDERLADLEAFRGKLPDKEINKLARDIKLSAKECEHLAELVPTPTLRIAHIQKVVAKHFNVTVIDMISARRTKNVIRPRQIAMYLCRLLTLRTLPEIGRRFGGRDHTTVLHAVQKISDILNGTQTSKYSYRLKAGDGTLADDIEAIKAALS